eukprot:TRINITY_DN25793_c0_g1_i1.p1 TRINITY_DN25793_c0_g1~~TRINITY_DN25793_c0_g1_i1.p1  ORF type:complete len:326 (+),score=54.14 TRINITY_DN25793_c0_g1_i1:72-1049(+)
MSAYSQARLGSRRVDRQTGPSTHADCSITSESTAIMWDPPTVGSSCGEGTADDRLLRYRSFGAADHAPTGHIENPRAGRTSAPIQQHQISQPLRFPFWHSEHVEQEEESQGGEEVEQASEICSHGGQDERIGLRPESLAERLLQAERGLAEKDQRIKALEACTRKLVERLELAEGLSSTLPKEREKQPSTPASTRSTSGSTSWTNSDLVRCMLLRDRTIDSLGSVGSAIAPVTPKTPSTKSHFLAPRSASESVTKRQAHCWGANSSPYASAADVDVVCRRSERLLKAMTAVVAHGEKRLPRQTSPSTARNSPRSGELRSSSKLCF